jgi:hypothetical protein
MWDCPKLIDLLPVVTQRRLKLQTRNRAIADYCTRCQVNPGSFVHQFFGNQWVANVLFWKFSDQSALYKGRASGARLSVVIKSAWLVVFTFGRWLDKKKTTIADES